MDIQLCIVLGVLVLFIIMMLSGKFSFPLIGITCVLILVLTGALGLSEGFAGFADKNVVMLAGMFAIAGELGKTSIVDVLKNKLLSAKGGSDLKVVFLLLVVSAILSQVIPSQTSIIMIMMTFLMALGTDGEVTLSRMLLPITFVLTSWLGKFPIGGPGVTTYMMLNQFIEAAGGSQLLDLTSIMKCTLVPGIITMAYCIFTYKWLPKKDVDMGAYQSRGGERKQEKLSKKNENLIYIAFGVSIAGLVLTGKIGDIGYAVPLAVVIVMIYLKAMD